MRSLVLLLAVVGCQSPGDIKTAPTETGHLTGDTGDSGDSGDSAESGGETGHTGDSSDTGSGDTSTSTTAPRGWVDHVDCDGVWGWALDDDQPDTSLSVVVDFGGTRVTAVADQPRPDVCGSDPCYHGFGVDVPAEVQDGSSRAITVYAVDPASGGETSLGGGNLACGGGGGTDTFTYLYQDGASYVRYQPMPNEFEKSDGGPRDTARRMMPIDLHTWSIANFDRDLLMFSHFRLYDASGVTLFEYNDTEGAVHVTLAKTERELERGNNHQTELSDFLIVEGTYTIEYTLTPDSVGHPSLMLWRQREGNHFLMVVGASVTGVEQDDVNGDDGILVDFGETVTRSFDVGFLDEDNALYKSNANGFETP